MFLFLPFFNDLLVFLLRTFKVHKEETLLLANIELTGNCSFNTLIRIYIYLRLRFSAVTASFNKYSNRQKTRKILSQKQNTDRANIFHGSILRNMFFAFLMMKIHAPTINIVVSIPPAGTNLTLIWY